MLRRMPPVPSNQEKREHAAKQERDQHQHAGDPERTNDHVAEVHFLLRLLDHLDDERLRLQQICILPLLSGRRDLLQRRLILEDAVIKCLGDLLAIRGLLEQHRLGPVRDE